VTESANKTLGCLLVLHYKSVGGGYWHFEHNELYSRTGKQQTRHLPLLRLLSLLSGFLLIPSFHSFYCRGFANHCQEPSPQIKSKSSKDPLLWVLTAIRKKTVLWKPSPQYRLTGERHEWRATGSRLIVFDTFSFPQYFLEQCLTYISSGALAFSIQQVFFNLIPF